MADLLSWIALQKWKSQIFHYLDDFLLIGPPLLWNASRILYIYTNMHQPGLIFFGQGYKLENF